MRGAPPPNSLAHRLLRFQHLKSLIDRFLLMFFVCSSNEKRKCRTPTHNRRFMRVSHDFGRPQARSSAAHLSLAVGKFSALRPALRSSKPSRFIYDKACLPVVRAESCGFCMTRDVGPAIKRPAITLQIPLLGPIGPAAMISGRPTTNSSASAAIHLPLTCATRVNRSFGAAHVSA